MAKAKTIYSCPEYGASAPKWQGPCPGCGAWNTLIETIAETASTGGGNRYDKFAALAGDGKLQKLSDIRPCEEPRIQTGIVVGRFQAVAWPDGQRADQVWLATITCAESPAGC